MSFIEKLKQEFSVNHGCEQEALIRDSAFEAFLERGLPTRRNDHWRYTNLRNLSMMEPYAAADQRSIESILAELPGEFVKLVIVDGQPRQDLSDLELVWNKSSKPAQINPDKHPMAVLNLAMNQGGLEYHLADETVLTQPLVIVNISTASCAGKTQYLRHSIHLGKRSRASLLMLNSATASLVHANNVLVEIVLEEGASLQYSTTHSQDNQSIYLEGVHLEQRASSSFEAFVLSLEPALSRFDFTTQYLGPQAQSKITGVYSIKGKQHTDIHLNAEHCVPHCSTYQSVRGVLDEQAKAVFNGRVCVHPQAVNSNSQQENHNLLLSSTAEVDTKPELEIHNDSVKCTHGATVGQLDQDALFYLQARGITEEQARQILRQAFVIQSFDEISDRALSNFLRALYHKREGGLDES